MDDPYGYSETADAGPADTPPHRAHRPRGQELTSDERSMGMLVHLLGLAGFVVPLANFIGPLILWLTKRDESAFLDDQGRESLNFQISMFLWAIVFVILALTIVGLVVAIPGLIVMGLATVILPIIGAIKANEGQRYRYPFTIRLL
ncbi:MAG: DUF4870 domain-containing protein [Chloroflexota bacterium]